ncbi:hypothetical protein N1851_003768 [Merluccius polli]|uniref:Secreted protein n=1 Tax=Merluccius polli TaxID=89951 RepID=A0AA47N969_MERPO|nr:hypothetical protein N1851_003768 [Merluccius polli]
MSFALWLSLTERSTALLLLTHFDMMFNRDAVCCYRRIATLTSAASTMERTIDDPTDPGSDGIWSFILAVYHFPRLQGFRGIRSNKQINTCMNVVEFYILQTKQTATSGGGVILMSCRLRHSVLPHRSDICSVAATLPSFSLLAATGGLGVKRLGVLNVPENWI